MTGPDDEATAQRWRRSRPVRVALDIADRVLRADTADACDDAGIAVTGPDEPAGDADVILADRPVATAVPAIVLVADESLRAFPGAWPANVRAAVPADVDAEMLAAVITVVAAGYVLTSRTDTDDAESEDAIENAGSWTAPGSAADEPGSALSAREREVLALLAGGASNKEIARALALSVSTVKFHVAAIMDKLGARSRVDAVAIAVRAGLVMV